MRLMSIRKWLSHFDQSILPLVASKHDDEYEDMLRQQTQDLDFNLTIITL